MTIPTITRMDSTLTFVEVNKIGYWFSYSTLVAFKDWSGTFVRENIWGFPVSIHLDTIDGGDTEARSHRHGDVNFNRILNRAMKAR